MRIIVTCGPSYEPIDQVRRITNFSTGELGVMLASALANAGHAVTCFKGEGATVGDPPENVDLRRFSTNENLVSEFAAYAREQVCDAIFHAAALSDFRIKGVFSESGEQLRSGKILSSLKGLVLQLEPAVKVISLLPKIFPHARIIGWKYEVNGLREQALEKAKQQLTAYHSLACVVNGPAWGEGFGVVGSDDSLREFPDKAALCAYLTEWIGSLKNLSSPDPD